MLTWRFIMNMLNILISLRILGWRSVPRETIQPVEERRQGALQPQKIRLLCHNMWCHYLVGGGSKFSRLTELVKLVGETGFDVVCLQEVFLFKLGFLGAQQEMLLLIELMKKQGLVYHSCGVDSLPKFIGQNAGLITFSRYPIASTRQHSFAYSAELANAKGWEFCDIDVRGKRVAIVNTHFDSRSVEGRESQIRELDEKVFLARESVPKNTPLVVCGDFNIAREDEKLYKSLCQKMAAYSLADQFPTAGVDHVFLDQALSPVLQKPAIVSRFDPQAQMQISDHDGLDITIAL